MPSWQQGMEYADHTAPASGAYAKKSANRHTHEARVRLIWLLRSFILCPETRLNHTLFGLRKAAVGDEFLPGPA
jgi:hypothetical protein